MFESLGVFAIAALLVVSLQGSATSDLPPVEDASTLRTPWGHPDVQGIWFDEVDTPFERPDQYKGREFLTEAEVAAQDEQRTQMDGGFNYSGLFMSVKRTGRRTSLVIDPANGRIPPLTPEAEKGRRLREEFRMALLQNTDTCKYQLRECKGWPYGPPSTRRGEPTPFYNTGRLNRHNGPEDVSYSERCLGGTTPDFAGFKRIVQSPASLAIGVDTGQGQGFQRVVYFSGSHPPPHLRLRHGDSRGRVEGDTLVIETTNFSVKYPFRGAAENLAVVESFRRVDADTLEYTVTISDPTVWTSPWVVRQDLRKQPDDRNQIYYEPRCHEGNFGLVGTLVGARADEKAFAEGLGPNPASIDKDTFYTLGSR
jgi:hypothetical protein